jgi:formate dehydrogenase maturation protein FdhE
MKRSKWDQRIQRAAELVPAHPFAAEGLRFYKGVASFQKGLYAYVDAVRGNDSRQKIVGSFDESLDLPLLLPKFSEFLSCVGAFSPTPLAESAADLKSRPDAESRDLLAVYWKTRSDSNLTFRATEGLLAWIFLQPYAEILADHGERKPGWDNIALCPFCGGKPLVGVLRPEGDGAKRFLICALCSTEWAFRRILCASCGEEAVEKLAVYTANEFGHVRVEGCDTCQHYIKTVDLTKNGHAVPVVDELATIPLNLWAQEHGYTKVQPNLLGI